jgi:hypothetical protein
MAEGSFSASIDGWVSAKASLQSGEVKGSSPAAEVVFMSPVMIEREGTMDEEDKDDEGRKGSAAREVARRN